MNTDWTKYGDIYSNTMGDVDVSVKAAIEAYLADHPQPRRVTAEDVKVARVQWLLKAVESGDDDYNETLAEQINARIFEKSEIGQYGSPPAGLLKQNNELAEALQGLVSLEEKLANANKRIEELQHQIDNPWIPVTERMPTKDDADEQEWVLVIIDGKRTSCDRWNKLVSSVTHWQPARVPKPVEKTEEEKSREAFESKFKGRANFSLLSGGVDYSSDKAQMAWEAWQAARKGAK